MNFLYPVLLNQCPWNGHPLFWGYWVGQDLDADLFSIAWFCVTVHLTVSVTLLVIENSHSLQFSLTTIKTVPSPQEFPSYQTINHKPRLYKHLHMWIKSHIRSGTIFLWTFCFSNCVHCILANSQSHFFAPRYLTATGGKFSLCILANSSHVLHFGFPLSFFYQNTNVHFNYFLLDLVQWLLII